MLDVRIAHYQFYIIIILLLFLLVITNKLTKFMKIQNEPISKLPTGIIGVQVCRFLTFINL